MSKLDRQNRLMSPVIITRPLLMSTVIITLPLLIVNFN
jgi:hypothetical protein